MSITAPPNLKVSAKDALYFFEKILQTQGLALVPRANSNVVEILPAAEARFLRLNISQEVPQQEDWEVTDDASLLERAGIPVHLIPGEETNLKITTPLDLEFARFLSNHSLNN